MLFLTFNVAPSSTLNVQVTKSIVNEPLTSNFLSNLFSPNIFKSPLTSKFVFNSSKLCSAMETLLNAIELLTLHNPYKKNVPILFVNEEIYTFLISNRLSFQGRVVDV